MPQTRTLFVVSDIHYAGPSERLRGCPELELIGNPLLRVLVKAYRHFIWRRDPFAHNHLLNRFMAAADRGDYVIANGDYSCDTAFVGVCDDASYQSACECVTQMRDRFGSRLRLTLGDHELGKMSLFGGCGGIRLASWQRAQQELGIAPFWTLDIGAYRLIGVTSSVLAFPVFAAEALPAERAEWEAHRKAHFDLIRDALQTLAPRQRAVLFCHDPTALPFLWNDDHIRARVPQIETTIIGHLHSNLFLWKSRLLAGMPVLPFLGNSIRRMSTALHDARLWRNFRVQLCPSLAGIELLKDGGYCRIDLDPEADRPLKLQTQRFARS